MRYLAVLLLALAGCNSFALDAQWRPLQSIVERPENPWAAKDTISTTIGDIVYMANLDEWLVKNPPDSTSFARTLYHEQLHSKRQLAYGTKLWLSRYVLDKSFMLYEEQLGYYVTIKYSLHKGLLLNIWGIARVMNRYKNAGGHMITEIEALKWATQVLEGTWKPKDSDLWSLPDFAK